MKKRGFIDGFSFIVFFIVVASIGGATYVITQEGKQIDVSNYYIGDSLTHYVYNPSCINRIPKENLVFFPSIDVAKTSNYTFRNCGSP